MIRQPCLIPQAPHYNQVLTEISPDSKYCKFAQADDTLFSDCLRLMAETFERFESVGLVSSYYLKGSIVKGSGFPYPKRVLPGKEAARFYLQTGNFVFGSVTTVMYRSSLVRDCQPFYREDLLHEDTEKCMEILKQWDFGFIPQVLSFLRTDNVNESVTAGWRAWQPDALDWYIIVHRFADVFLEPAEARELKLSAKRDYYHMLAAAALKRRDAAFWEYHRKGLATLGQTMNKPYIALLASQRLLDMAANPGHTLAHACSRIRKTR